MQRKKLKIQDTPDTKDIRPGAFTCPDKFTKVVPDENVTLPLDDENYEFILIKTPAENFDINHLDGNKIDLNKRSSCGNDNVEYEYFSSELKDQSLKKFCLIIPQQDTQTFIAKSIPVTQQILITRTLEIPNPILPKPVKKTVAFPEGLKQRYQPFGSDNPPSPTWKRKKHKKSISPSKEKKSSKKRKRSDLNGTEDESSETANELTDPSNFQPDNSVDKSSSSSETEPKRKRHKKSGSEKTMGYEANSDFQFKVPEISPKKRQKKSSSSSETEHRKHKVSSSSSDSDHKKRKKKNKHKHKHRGGEDTELGSKSESSSNSEKEKRKKHKKRKKNSVSEEKNI